MALADSRQPGRGGRRRRRRDRGVRPRPRESRRRDRPRRPPAPVPRPGPRPRPAAAADHAAVPGRRQERAGQLHDARTTAPTHGAAPARWHESKPAAATRSTRASTPSRRRTGRPPTRPSPRWRRRTTSRGPSPPTGRAGSSVQVSNAFSADPGKVTSTEYLLFTQAASGGAGRTRSSPTCWPARTPRRSRSAATGSRPRSAPPRPRSRSPRASSRSEPPRRSTAPGRRHRRRPGRAGRPLRPDVLARQAADGDRHRRARGRDRGRRADLRAAHHQRRRARLLHRRRRARDHPAGRLGAPPDRPRLLLPRPGAVPGRAQLPRPVRRRRPPGRRGHPARRRRVLRPHRQELSPPQPAPTRTPHPALRPSLGRGGCMSSGRDPRAAPRYCRGASREGEVKSPPRYLKVWSSGSGSP